MQLFNSSWSILELIYYLSTPLLVIIGFLGLKSIKHAKEQITLVSDELSLAKKQLAYQVEKDTIKNAVELTKYYIDYIIPELDNYRSLLANSNYFEEIKKFDYKLFNKFNQEELHNIIKFSHKCKNSKEVFDRIEYIEECINDTFSKPLTIDKNGQHLELRTLPLNKLLNKIEYFCMNFITGVADEETVYRAIHQTFLGNIRHLYFPIASRNTHPKDKLYNNIIELYQRWNSRDCELEEKYAQAIKEQNEAINCMTNIGKKISNPI